MVQVREQLGAHGQTDDRERLARARENPKADKMPDTTLNQDAEAILSMWHNRPADQRLTSFDVCAITLAKAYLAEHPDDDAEPLDEPFLLACGFVYLEAFREYAKSGIRFHAKVAGMPEHWTLFGVGCLDHLKTRGQLRALLTALGIEAKS